MAIKIKFDSEHNPEKPTFVLATRSGAKLGELFTAQDDMVQDNLTSASEISLTVYKELDGVELPLWDDITALKLIWVREWDKYFQIDIDTEQTNETVKHITGTSLSEAELSQIYLHNIEINTEGDILNDDYTVTVLYDANNPKGSLLDRLLADKAPHYTIAHVDSTIAKIQRTFSFDNITILDAFYEIAEEIGCIFIFDSGSNEDGSIARTIKVYDLETACMNDNCEYYQDYSTRYRTSSMTECPKCGGTNLLTGYGEDTTIFVSNDNLSDDITKTPDTDSMKNCFKLIAGDDLMTSVIMSCNPAGTQYIWNIPDSMRQDMSAELQAALEAYDALYYEYQHTKEFDSFDEETIAAYNELIEKYLTYDEDLKQITLPVVGFSGLTEILYDLIDFELLLQTSLMPDTTITESDVAEQAELIEAMVADFNNTISLTSISSGTSQATTESSLKLLIRAAINTASYSFEITTESFSNTYTTNGAITWSGYVTVTSEVENDDGEYDSATTSTFTLTIDNDYQNYIEQLIYKTVSSDDTEDFSITGLFSKEGDEFTTALAQYSLDNLEIIHDCCQGVLDVLLDYGAGESSSEFYDVLYHPYYVKLQAIESEMDLRDSEIAIILAVEDAVDELRNEIADTLDFEANLGETLWTELCAYRREDTYENSNYISDGLTNAELVSYALQFLERAEEELLKASTLQHTISTTLHNLLVIPEFSVLVDYFSVGNWIRVEIDGEIYRLRLVSYEIDYNDLTTIQVEFSDVEYAGTTNSDLGSLFSSMSAVASSYDSTKNQVSKNSKLSAYVSGWVNDGLDITNTNVVNNNDNQYQIWDEHGILLKKYNAILDDYEDTQMKLVNRGLYLTDDNWETVRTAIGLYWYNDPETGELISTYGIMADTLVGELILGENLGIYNDDGKLSFDENGLTITNGTNTFTVDPSSDQLLVLSNADGAILYVDADGNLQITAESITIAIEDEVTSQVTKITSTSVTSIRTEFTISSSNTELDEDCEWSTDTPTKTTSQPYIWMRSVYIYGDGTVVDGDPVCISGADGTTISSSEVTYQIGTSGSEVPEGDWTEDIPEMSQGDYLWTRTVVEYSDGTTTTTYTVSHIGSDITVSGYEIEYQTSTDGTTPPDGEWASFITAEPGSFVWTRVTTYYSDGASTISYSVSYIAQDGDDGRGVATITEYYAVTSTSSSYDSATWYTSENIPEMDEENKYLWNYEEVVYTDGTTEETTPVIIGVYGVDGEDGVGISKIEEYYAISTNATEEPDESEFSTAIPTMTATYKYLWNYEVVYYTDGNSYSTAAVIIGVYGDSATSLSLVASTYVVAYDENGVVKDDTAISLEAIQQNYSDEITWTATGSSSTGEITLDGTGATRTLDVAAFDDNEAVVVTISAGGLSDTATIVKVQDGGNAINVILTNEAHTFAGTTNAAIASSAKTEVIGYVGTEQVATTINSITGCPDGMTYTISNNGEIGTSITFAVSTTMITQYGTITISCTCGDIDVEKVFSYTLALNGANGVGIESITEYYALSTSNETVTEDWQTTVPTMTSELKYLWNYEVITFTDGTSETGEAKVIGVYGNDGVGIASIVNYYLCSETDSDVDILTGDWSTEVQTVTEEYRYLWNYEVVSYTDGTEYVSSPCIIGTYSVDGEDGVGIESITEYYAVSDSNSVEPSSWYTTLQTMTETYKYLWNYETVTRTDGTTMDTTKRVIGVYGTDGIGIESITNYYLRSEYSEGIDTSTSGWTTTVQAITPEYKYLWNYEVVVYTDETSYTSTPCIIGVYGDTGASGSDGVGIVSIVEYYAVTRTTTLATGDTTSSAVVGYAVVGESTIGDSDADEDVVWYSSEDEDMPTLTATYKYLWNYEEITYTDGSVTTTTPVIIGTYGEDGTGIESITEYYLATDLATGVTIKTSGWTDDPTSANATVTAAKKYLWNYEIITYTDGTTSETAPVIIGAYGDTGVGISEYKIYYYVTSGSYDEDASTITVEEAPDPNEDSSGWSETQPTLQDGEYLWIAYEITYSDGTTGWTSPTLLTDITTRANYITLTQYYNETVDTLYEHSQVLGEISTEKTTDEDGNEVVVYVSETISNIQQKADEIALTVENQTIGGRNYALTSGNYTEDSDLSNWFIYPTSRADHFTFTACDGYVRIMKSSSTSGANTACLMLSDAFEVSEDTEYTYTIKCRVNEDIGITLGIGTLYDGETDEIISFNSDYADSLMTNNWLTITGTFIPYGNINSDGDSYSLCFTLPTNMEDGTYLDVAYIMLEKGNVATDWRPAPEDVDADIDGVSAKLALTIETDEYGYAYGMISANASYISLTGNVLVIDSDNFTLTKDGKITAVDGEFSGTINASAGTIGGFTIGDNALYNSKSSLNSTDTGVYVGTDGISLGSYFSVTSAGIISAKSGTIGHLTISSASNTDADSGHIYRNSIYVQAYGINETVWSAIEDDETYTIGIDREFGLKAVASSGTELMQYLWWKPTTTDDYSWPWSNESANSAVCMYYVTGRGKIKCSGITILPDRAVSYNPDDGSISGYDSELACVYTDNSYIHLDYVKFSAASSGNDGAIYSDFDPASSNTYDMGGSSWYWRRVYAGTMHYSSTASLSDRKLKQNITPIDTDDYTNFIMGLSPVTYDFIKADTHRKHMGFIAQDVRDAAFATVGDLAMFKAEVDADDSINYDPEKYSDDEVTWSLSYEELIAPMVKMIQDLRNEVDELKRQIKEMS